MSAAPPAVPSILARILARKREEVAALRLATPRAELVRDAAEAPPVRGLEAALRRTAAEPVRAIAEIKRASPSAGPIRPGADPVAIAREYVDAGASAISILTDRDFFDGSLGFLGMVRTAEGVGDVPLLRKDFLIDEVQVLEARAAGADAVLLIVAALDDPQLRDLSAAARGLGMDALVEVHDEAEADRAVAAGATLIGVNHRDLATFRMDMSLTGRLARRLPAATVLVGESGIRGRAEVLALGKAGAHAVLVGEALMSAPAPGQALRLLLGEGDRW